MTNRCQLLVSVRSAEEAEIAVQSGVEWIDLKEPSHGPMGRPLWEVVEAFLRMPLPQKTFRSIAGGDIDEWSAEDLKNLAQIPHDCFIKIGLCRCFKTNWESAIQRVCESLGDSSQCILVHYADGDTVAAPRWEELLQAAKDCGCHYVLIDTYDKSVGCLLDFYSSLQLRRMIEQAQTFGQRVAVAGSIRFEHISTLLALDASWIGVRGAVCDGHDRNGRLVPGRIDQLRSMLSKRNEFNENVLR